MLNRISCRIKGVFVSCQSEFGWGFVVRFGS